MPNKSRFINNSFKFSADYLRALQPPDKLDDTKDLFGDVVSNANCSWEYTDCERNMTSEGGRSSSSSVSWLEDFDKDATQTIQDEFDRMERVLLQLEPIPPHYDRDEYQQWMSTFPQLRITGTKWRTKAEQIESDTETLKGNEYETNNSYKKLYKQSSTSTTFEKVHSSSSKSRQLSSHSVAKSDALSSKWFRRNDDYISLPLLVSQQRKEVQSKKIAKNANIVFPPIENLALRSISAIPRQYSSSKRQSGKKSKLGLFNPFSQSWFD